MSCGTCKTGHPQQAVATHVWSRVLGTWGGQTPRSSRYVLWAATKRLHCGTQATAATLPALLGGRSAAVREP